MKGRDGSLVASFACDAVNVIGKTLGKCQERVKRSLRTRVPITIVEVRGSLIHSTRSLNCLLLSVFPPTSGSAPFFQTNVPLFSTRTTAVRRLSVQNEGEPLHLSPQNWARTSITNRLSDLTTSTHFVIFHAPYQLHHESE